MPIDKFQRIMWRLREKKQESNAYDYILKDVRRAIILEVGGDQRTIDKYIDLLQELDILERINRWHFKDIGDVL